MPNELGVRSFDEIYADTKPEEKKKEEPGLIERATGGFLSTPQLSMEDFVRRAPNAASMALAGAPNPVAMGGLGAAGYMMNPSENPGMDTGALAGEVGAGKIAEMFMGGKGRLAKAGLNAAGVGLGAFMGHQADRMAQPDKEIPTPYGPIGLYMGTSALGLVTSAFAKPNVLSAMQSKADQIAELSGTATKEGLASYPLSWAESRGGGIFTRMLGRNSGAERALGEQQNEFAQKAFNKITGSSWDAMTKNVEAGLEAQKTLKSGYKDWKAANTPQVLNEAGEKVPGKPNWDKLSTDFGLTPEERQAFFEVVRAKPEMFVDKFVTSNESQMKGLFGLRAMKKMLSPEEFAPLGKALVFRMLDKHGAFTQTAEGLVMSGEKFEKALFQSFGEDRLKLALGAETTEALKVLATVMKEADPAKKLKTAGSGQAAETVSYAANKAAFAITSLAAGAMAGSQVGGANVAVTLSGAGLGATVAVPLYNIVAKLMNSPWLAKGLYEGTQGNATRLSKVVRTLLSPDEKPTHEEKPSKPSSRIPIFPLIQ